MKNCTDEPKASDEDSRSLWRAELNVYCCSSSVNLGVQVVHRRLRRPDIDIVFFVPYRDRPTGAEANGPMRPVIVRLSGPVDDGQVDKIRPDSSRRAGPSGVAMLPAPSRSAGLRGNFGQLLKQTADRPRSRILRD